MNTYTILTNIRNENKIQDSEVFMHESELTLRSELDYYSRNCEEWIRRYGQGKYVVISKDNMLGPYDQETTAYFEGIKNFGLEPFLIQRLTIQLPTETVPALILGVIHAC